MKLIAFGLEMLEAHRPQQILGVAENFDEIVLYEGEFDFWRGHPLGCIIRQGNKFLINGTEVLYEGEYNGWCPHPEGVVIYTTCPMLDGEVELPNARPFSWGSNPNGKVTRHGDCLMLNDRVLYEGPIEKWKSHHQGVAVELEGEILINGITVCGGEIVMWDSHPRGILVQKEDRISLIVFNSAA